MEEGRGEKGSGTLLSVLPADGEVGVAGDSRLKGRHLQCIIMAGNIYWCRYSWFLWQPWNVWSGGSAGMGGDIKLHLNGKSGRCQLP